jgi:hypothetical protein
MNRKQALTALALVVAGSAAFAQTEVELQHFGAPQASTTTRAAVRAEVIKARANGETLNATEADVAGVFQKAPAPAAQAASTVTRAQRRAEVLAAQADGSLNRPAEIGVFTDRAVASTKTRDEVRQEAIAATRSGQARVQAGH